MNSPIDNLDDDLLFIFKLFIIVIGIGVIAYMVWKSIQASCNQPSVYLESSPGYASSRQNAKQLDIILSTAKSIDIPSKFYVALDCEMVEVTDVYSKRYSALARCSIVDYNGYVIYDEYIRPREKITNYRTPWSGIRRYHMISAVPEGRALREIYRILENRIIIGHGLKSDLAVLKLQATPCYMLRDTSQCNYLHRLVMATKGIKTKNKLRDLTFHLLGRRIQTGSRGHNSVEDAVACLDLFKLARSHWEPDLICHWMISGYDMKNIIYLMKQIDSEVYSAGRATMRNASRLNVRATNFNFDMASSNISYS